MSDITHHNRATLRHSFTVLQSLHQFHWLSAAQHRRRQPHKLRHTPRKPIASTIAITLIGIAILLYPVAASLYNNFRQYEVTQHYEQTIAHLNPQQLEHSYEQAKQYNATFARGPITDPWLARISTDNVDYQLYLRQLNNTEVMARLIAPSIHVDLPIYHGTSEHTLQRGIGHLYGSDLPVGGANTHAVLTGHTGLSNATLFDNLHQMRKNDVFYIEVANHTLAYKVASIETVTPDQTQHLQQVPGKDLVTLITCTPYGINSHRLLVHAQRIPLDENAAHQARTGFHLAVQWWMWVLGLLALTALIWLIWWTAQAVRINTLYAAAQRTMTPEYKKVES